VDTTATKVKIPKPGKERNGLPGSSALAKPPLSASPAVQPVRWMKLTADPNLELSSRQRVGPPKILLRIDAFLGEWLSPDYFDQITPPPNSTMMVAGAKADLLRRGDYVEAPPTKPQSKGHFPGGWKNNAASAIAGRKHCRFVSGRTARAVRCTGQERKIWLPLLWRLHTKYPAISTTRRYRFMPFHLPIRSLEGT
jgi:hypothetical protein